LTDLIGEAGDTKSTIEEAHASIQNANEVAHSHVNHAVRKTDMFESNLFEFDPSAPAPPVQQHSVPRQPAMSYDSMDYGAAPSHASVASGDHFSVHSGQPLAQTRGIPLVETASSEEGEPAGGAPPDANAPPLFENEGFVNEYNPPVQQQPVQQQPVQQQQQQQQTFQPEPQPQQPPQPTLKIERPVAITQHHKRESYGGFGSDFVMGGSADPLPEDSHESAMSPAAHSVSDGSAYGYDDEESYKIVEDMKKKAEMAAETARDAEAAHRKLANESDELRQDADKAEATSRSLRAAGQEKKKGRFGGGKKKNMLVRIIRVHPLGFPNSVSFNDFLTCRKKQRKRHKTPLISKRGPCFCRDKQRMLRP
jgi:hypothetical protein